MFTITMMAAVILGLSQDPATSAEPTSAPVTQAMEWQVFSQSRVTAYLMDVGSIVMVGDATTFRVAKVPIDKAATPDVAWRTEDISVRCAANQYRSVKTTEFAADGSVLDSYDGEDVWDPVESSYASGLKEFACDGARANNQSFPTLAAFMASRR